MSFTQHLHDGLGYQLAQLTPAVEDTADRLAQQLAKRSTIRPPDGAGFSDLGTVGQIVGQRLAEHVQPAPWYAALHGAVRTGALGRSDVDRIVRAYPTHVTAPAPALLARPTPHGWAQVGSQDGAVDEDSEPLVSRAFAEHARMLGRASDIGADEASRVQLYGFLARFESAYRGSGDVAALQRACITGTLPELGPAGTDAARVLSDMGPVTAQLHAGYAAPVLLPQWAEGDLLSGGCLMEAKATLSTKPQKIAEALRQLIGYALLDVGDRWRIRSVGLVLARQRAVWQWHRTTWSEVFGLRDVLGVKQRRWAKRAFEAAESDGLGPEVRKLWKQRVAVT